MRIFGRNRKKEVTANWGKLQTEKRHNLYFSPNITGVK
jgi:hypothetical protein